MLNKQLYDRLEELFGDIKIYREDESAEVKSGLLESRITRSNVFGNRNRTSVREVSGGERYAVTCPFCGKKDKLWFSYLYNSSFEEESGKKVNAGGAWLVCYYCHFEKDKEKKYQIRKEVGNIGCMESGAVSMNFAGGETRETSPIELPSLYPLTDSPECVDLCLSKRHNPETLMKEWGVCASRDPGFFQDSTYLVAPILAEHKQVGWQGRFAGDDWKLRGLPKFRTEGHKARWLYNQDRACLHPELGVLVEGFWDVWRGGSYFCAPMGTSISNIQMQKLSVFWKNGALVIIFDQDPNHTDGRSGWELADEYVWKMNAQNMFAKKAHALKLEGDPDDYSREHLMEEVCRVSEIPISTIKWKKE